VPADGGRPRPDLAQILASCSLSLAGLGRDRARAVLDIINCRTAALGGHLYECDTCQSQVPVYNSCGNRSCPKCQSLDQARWVQAQASHLLPVAYFHLVFTIPIELHPFFRRRPRLCYRLLMQAAAQTVLAVCRDKLGCTPGILAMLHTWTQILLFHPHVHCVATGGGLSLDGQAWIHSHPRFFLPVLALSTVFRGKLLAALEAALLAGELGVTVDTGRGWLHQATAQPWNVYSKPPMAGPEQALAYLGRYTNRTAIGNERILSFQGGKVTFRYRNRKRGNRSDTMSLDTPDFVHRFLQHVLPRHFVRIRRFGILANGIRSTRLKRARVLLHAPVPPQPQSGPAETWVDLYRRLTGRDPTRCPACRHGTLHPVAELEPTAEARGP
jgi:hypothetical protein